MRCSPFPTPCEPTLKKRHAEEKPRVGDVDPRRVLSQTPRSLTYCRQAQCRGPNPSVRAGSTVGQRVEAARDERWRRCWWRYGVGGAEDAGKRACAVSAGWTVAYFGRGFAGVASKTALQIRR